MTFADNLKDQIGSSGYLSWAQLGEAWPGLAPATRRALLRETARSLHFAWRSGGDIRAWRLDSLGWNLGGPAVALHAAGEAETRNGALPAACVIRLLGDWYVQTRDVVAPRDCLRFLFSFLRGERIRRGSLRSAAEQVVEASRQSAQARARYLYRLALREPPGGWRGLSAERLRSMVAEAESAGQELKSTATSRIVRARADGRSILIKRYRLPGWLKFKYLLRVARARRAFAGARALGWLGMRTPAPLGYIEERRGFWPGSSVYVSEYLEDAVDARRWYEERYPSASELERAAFRRELAQVFTGLHRIGVYHADTKLSNLLVRRAPSGEGWEWYWIDLQCLQFGRRLTRHRLMRNLVQLYAAFPPSIPDGEKERVLNLIAETYAWAGSPAARRAIARRTEIRLERERQGIDGF